MSGGNPSAEGGQRGWMSWMLDVVERTGNRLPDPITVFVIFAGVVLLASWLGALLGLSAVHPAEDRVIEAENLITGESLQRVLVEMPDTFTDFPPLGLVLVVMIGIGVAERSGLVETALKAFVRSVPDSLITAAIVLAGLLSSLAVDAGYVVLIPLGALIFHGLGRHPLAGLAAAFAGVSGGFSANLSLTALDPLLASFTEPASHIVDPTYSVDVTANWWLMIAMVPIYTLAGWWVTERIVEPRLGTYEGKPEEEGDEEGAQGEAAAQAGEELGPEEKRGLWAAGLTFLGTLLVIALLAIPADGALRADEPDLLDSIQPLLDSIVALMLFVFFLPGLVYGLVTRNVRSDKDVATMTSETMASMGAYIVLAFVAAHFIAFFDWSNLGVILAITGAEQLEVLQAFGVPGVAIIVAFVLVSAFINLFIGSASAKWAIMAPVFVPMLMLAGYSPELTQAAYRLGDSFTNILTPLLPYYPLVIIFAQRYQKGVGLGTIISAMLPYAVVFAAGSIGMLILWMLLEWPLGPGVPMFLE